jgi:uncharacterized RDD family membrane protein YckC
MSQVAQQGVGPVTMDPYEIGWYIESADEDTYGPVSRKSLQRFLEDKTITPNTLVRHCTQAEAKPAAEQPTIMQNLNLDLAGPSIGDHLDEAWPSKKRDQLALAEDSLPCWKHRRPAVLVCVRCHAPYCNKCRARPFKRQFFLCRRCQVGMWNRRWGALILDTLLLIYLPVLAVMIPLIIMRPGAGGGPETAGLLVNVAQLIGFCLLFVRDAIFAGASIGKRAAGLRVVQSKDGKSPLTFVQGIVRWLSQLVPIFNLVDAVAAYSDPLQRRFGDRWAGTRVIDSVRKLAKDRNTLAKRLIKKKGIQPPPEFEMTMEGFARLV